MPEKPKVLYISYDGMTDPLGQSQVLPYLTGISAGGYEIHLISFEKEELFHRNEALIRNICLANNIRWIPLKYHKNPPILSTLFDIWKLFIVAKKEHKKHLFQIIHCRSYIAAFAGLFFKKKYGVKFIFDMRGFWPEERVDGGLWNLKNPVFKFIYHYFKKKEKDFLLAADEVITLTHKAKEYLLQNKAYQKQSITVIPCCVDEKLFTPAAATERKAIRHQLGIGDDTFVLLYLGSIGTWYLPDEMLQFFNTFSQHQAHAEFWFITKENPDMILEKAKSKGIDVSKIIIKSAERKEVVNYIRAADLGIFFIKNTFSKSASSPVKQGEMMACGLPVVCNAGIGDTDFIVKKYNSGILVEELDERFYHKAISSLENVQFDTNHISAGAKDYFSLEQGIQKYVEVYRK
jgi:glycosyltransferase involved in cell wall biosynthesis